jgi:hypothetical protein
MLNLLVLDFFKWTLILKIQEVQSFVAEPVPEFTLKK